MIKNRKINEFHNYEPRSYKNSINFFKEIFRKNHDLEGFEPKNFKNISLDQNLLLPPPLLELQGDPKIFPFLFVYFP